MKKNIKNPKAITLISLVITVIILLVLAGVTIATLTGENGLLNRAKTANEESKYAAAEEKVTLAVSASYDNAGTLSKDLLKANVNNIDGIEEKIETVTYPLSVKVDTYEFTITEVGSITCLGRTEGTTNLPENTPTTDAGTEVALKDGWGTQTASYYKTSDGTEVTGTTTVATVYAVSDGNVNTIPVPNGFYYVGGNLDTGVIISDNSADKYENGKDKTTYSYNIQLQGNQFVWIPCTTIEYAKTSWEMQNANWDTTTPSSEVTQIQKYGGFYVARYEAGLAEAITEFTTTQVHNGSNPIYNLNGVPQSKAGQIPWMFVDWTHSKANAESMYNTSSVNSGLITGTQWDVMLNRIVEKTDLETADLKSSSSWGNYRDTAIAYKGRLSRGYVSESWYLPAFGTVTEETTSIYNSDGTYGDLLTTGASNVTEKYHLYDVAGNLWEWTEEASIYETSNQYRVVRGGSYVRAYATYPACYRNGGNTISHTDLNIGFRVVLYIK